MISSIRNLQLLRVGDAVKLSIPREHEVYGGHIVKIFPANRSKSFEEVERFFGQMLHGSNLTPLCEPTPVDYLVMDYGNEKYYCFPRNPLMVINYDVRVELRDELMPFKFTQVIPKGQAVLSDLGIRLEN